MLFDTHAHYDDEQFDGDRDALLSSMNENGVALIMNAASSLASSRAALALADKYPFIYAAVGVHPHDAKDMDGDTLPALEALLRHPKAVAVGEIGLDYHYDLSPRDVQQRRFQEQLALAESVGLPVVIHEREAARDVLDILGRFPRVTGVFHCFSGSWETAKLLLDKGWYLSFTGVITFKNARKSHEVIVNMPRDRLMIETDCPYLAPEPVRGRRNSSLNLKYTAAKAAELLGISAEETAALTTANGKRFFGIG
ncbi:TatD DNase family protein [Sporobacter termitidis DSM 10068]|uniref:TatD DNase family protein n=1 Tax=Sporobacter termitidis DSM 10068 TaxID=1123282 RepID=A0A1M5VPJ8_9FIRM|nr:TatD family hydrolase [Sporobacter termitidis]SHH77108.1 TatD DNase family protein [Sporobacter termitidis DSM 10068]